MKYRIVVVVENAGSNYSAYAPDVPGCITTGKTVEETLDNMRDALKGHLEWIANGLRVTAIPCLRGSRWRRTLCS